MGVKNIYERFIWFDSKVRGSRYPNATSLAKKFEISVKTAQRDIDFMRDRLRCPLEYEKSKKGYFYTDGTFSLPLIYLSSEELSSLLVARKLLQDLSGGCLTCEITSAVDKITSIIKKHTSNPDKIDDFLSFHLIEYSPAPEATFRTVLESCFKRKALSFKYSSPAREEKTERTVNPYHILNYMGTWHLIAYCHMRGELRNFKINRITDVKITDSAFSMPKDFDFDKYFASSFGLYKGGSANQVTLRFSPEKAKWIKDQIWHRDQKERTLEDGSFELSFPVADFSEIMREILKHGSGVKVIKPESLRKLIKSEAEEIIKNY